MEIMECWVHLPTIFSFFQSKLQQISRACPPAVSCLFTSKLESGALFHAPGVHLYHPFNTSTEVAKNHLVPLQLQWFTFTQDGTLIERLIVIHPMTLLSRCRVDAAARAENKTMPARK